MTIRRTLLVAFLVSSLLPAVVLTFLAFVQARAALERELARNLATEAATAMTQIDAMLFERLENIRTWTRLEVMQDIRVGDIDKRLSRVLADLRVGHDGYVLLFCTPTGSDSIVAASDLNVIGQQRHFPPPWQYLSFAGDTIAVDPLPVPVRRDEAYLGLHALIPDTFVPGKTVGRLHVMFDWGQISRILDQVERGADVGTQGRMAVLLDHDRHIIAASSALRHNGFPRSSALLTWLPSPAKSSAVIRADGRPFGTSEVLVGYTPSHGYQHFTGLGWSTLVVQATPQAFQPIRQMGASFLVLLAIAGLMATVASLGIASRLSNPIRTLADFTRHVGQQRVDLRPPVPGPGEVGELTRAFIQMLDDLERSRGDLVRAAKLAVVGELAAAMAHEVRTPLGILRTSAQMLQREQHLSPEGQEMAGFVVSETDRLNHLVSTLLDLARPRPPLFQAEDIHAIIRRAVELLTPRAARREVKIDQDLQAEVSVLPCDREQLMQVFLNLLLNALQVLPHGGVVAVQTTTILGRLVIEVSDSGPGIPQEHRRRIFESFFTTREDGIGLGLAIVHQIIRAHGGDITVDSSPLGGACFRFFLPQTRNHTDDDTTRVSS
ncbi:MAG: PAS domain-containing sensor histidine kinase [Candidatus Binatia bacterium]